MFNPYSCRPVGSARFEEHLKDVQTRQFYDTACPKEESMDNLWQLCEGSHLPWYEYDPKEDPYMNLMWAIVICTIIDYLDAYAQKLELGISDPKYWIWESRCIQLENEYFRKNPTLEVIFDKLLQAVCWQGEYEIEQCQKRLMRVNGWLKRPDKRQRKG